MPGLTTQKSDSPVLQTMSSSPNRFYRSRNSVIELVQEFNSAILRGAYTKEPETLLPPKLKLPTLDQQQELCLKQRIRVAKGGGLASLCRFFENLTARRLSPP
jgi:hypothetical protein